MRVHFSWDTAFFSPFVKCLRSLPNLHTLSIGRAYDRNITPLAKALKGVNLPQIKTLILLPSAYPLLQHCPNVEDIACSVNVIPGQVCDGFLGSLMSNRDSQIKRLTIPLVHRLLPNPPRK